jgi:hypothetical protein
MAGMKIEGGPLRGAAIVVLLATARAVAGPGDASEALWTRLRRIESDFQSGNADSLRASFSSTARLRVDLKGFTDRRASYAPGQLQVIFGEIFQEQRTREMAFDRNDVTLSSSGTAFARGRWVRRPRHGGAETVDSLTFTLREEGGDWRILEIRSSR